MPAGGWLFVLRVQIPRGQQRFTFYKLKSKYIYVVGKQRMTLRGIMDRSAFTRLKGQHSTVNTRVSTIADGPLLV